MFDGGNKRGRLDFIRALARIRFGAALLWICTPLTVFPSSAQAHPHVWVTIESRILYGPDGVITGVRHAWSFDDIFSAYATQGIAAKKKGTFTREELAPLAEVNVTSLAEYKFFTYARANGKKAPFTEPVDYWLDYADGILTLHFTLPLKTPVRAKAVDIEIYDPSFFVFFEFAKTDPVTLSAGPSGCRLKIDRPEELSVSKASSLTEEFFNALSASSSWGAQFTNKIALRCP